MHCDVVEKVQKLMEQLSCDVSAASILQEAPLAAEMANATRWSSCYQTLNRFLELKEVLRAVEHKEVNELMLADEEIVAVGQLCQRLQRLDFVTVKLQDDTTNWYRARVIFNGFIKACPNQKWRISSKANLTENVKFKNALVKIQSNCDFALRKAEERFVKHLLKLIDPQPPKTSEHVNSTEKSIS